MNVTREFYAKWNNTNIEASDLCSPSFAGCSSNFLYVSVYLVVTQGARKMERIHCVKKLKRTETTRKREMVGGRWGNGGCLAGRRGWRNKQVVTVWGRGKSEVREGGGCYWGRIWRMGMLFLDEEGRSRWRKKCKDEWILEGLGNSEENVMAPQTPWEMHIQVWRLVHIRTSGAGTQCQSEYLMRMVQVFLKITQVAAKALDYLLELEDKTLLLTTGHTSDTGLTAMD